MNLARTQSNPFNPYRVLGMIGQYSGLMVGVVIATALMFFEMFNYSTTEFALRDLMGELSFFGIHWSTLLSIAFCGIDFAGVVRLFTPDHSESHNELWYLFGAWMLAATMNAVLTWWGVSMAIANHPIASTSVVNPVTIIKVVPVFVAIMVWIIRILLIGSISMAGERLLFGQSKRCNPMQGATTTSLGGAASKPASSTTGVRHASTMRPSVTMSANPSRSEPTYQGISATASPIYQSASRRE